MKCQILFSGKNKKNISKCRLLKFLPRVLRVKRHLLLNGVMDFEIILQECLLSVPLPKC